MLHRGVDGLVTDHILLIFILNRAVTEQILLTSQLRSTFQEFTTVKSHRKDVPNLTIYILYESMGGLAQR